MVEIRDLSAGYGKREILRGVSLSMRPGTVTTLLGSNGCGKSTLLKAMLGTADIFGGDILLDGESARQMSATALAQKMAYLPQSKNTPDITVGTLVLHGRFPYLSYPRRYRREDYAFADAALRQMGIEDLAEERLQVLSGGQRQKVYIAMALAQQAGLIMMDEPTTYLDIGQQFRFARLARELAQQGKTLLLVLHDLPLALQISDTLAVLEEGKLGFVGAPAKIMDSDVLQRVFGVRLAVREEEGQRQYFCIPQ